MRIADRFRTEGKFQCSNISCGFQMAPASLLRKLNATNFKGLQSIVKKCAAVLFSKPRNFVRLQPWQRERREIALDSLILWPDIERSCGKQSKGIVSFCRLKQHSPLFLSYISSVLQKPPSPPYILYIWYCLISSRLLQSMNMVPLCFIHFKIFNLQWIDSS